MMLRKATFRETGNHVTRETQFQRELSVLDDLAVLRRHMYDVPEPVRCPRQYGRQLLIGA